MEPDTKNPVGDDGVAMGTVGNVTGTDFGTAAAAYGRGRPSYPAELVSWLVEGAVDIADIGAGTGKLTEALVQAAEPRSTVRARTSTQVRTPAQAQSSTEARVSAQAQASATGPRADILAGASITAVDPDERMLAALHVPGVEKRQGAAESLPLADASADALVFGQSWHWVDVPAACAEAARVLRPGGTLGLIWNIRDESCAWVAELTEIITSSAAEIYTHTLLAGIRDGVVSAVTNPAIIAAPFTALDHRAVSWTRSMSVDDLVDMVASRSYIIAAEVPQRDSILNRVRTLGRAVAGTAGRLELPYTTHAFRTRVPKRPRG